MAHDITHYTQRPEVQKIYTIAEMAELFDCSCDVIRNVVNRMQVPHDYETRNRARIAVFPYDSVRLIKTYFDKKEKARTEAALKRVTPVRQDQEEKAEDHPLVTNKEFLKLKVWPDTIPVVFQECEND